MAGSGNELLPWLLAESQSVGPHLAGPQQSPHRPTAGPHITQPHLYPASAGGQWRLADNLPNGMFVDGRHENSVTASGTTVRFGDPNGGNALAFESKEPAVDGQPGDHDNGTDPGLVRAGAAAAARRRELDISQRRLAADGIINAGALIAFEKGRSWPRERTRAKLEAVLQWPRGTIARIREGERAVPQQNLPTAPPTQSPPTSPPKAPAPGSSSQPSSGESGPASLIAQAVAAAVDTCTLAIAALPQPRNPDFTERAAPILADLRQLETIAVQATRISRITPELIKALGAVRRLHDKLMTLGATAPDAPLAQRLYAARRRANLSTLETAQAAGVSEETIIRAEAEEALPASDIEAIEALIRQLN